MGPTGVETPVERSARTRLVEERKHRGWSQRDLADYLGTTQHNVSRWEAGRTTPGPYLRTKLSELFGLPAQELLVLESNVALAEESAIITQGLASVNTRARQAALSGDWGGTVRDKEGRAYQLTLQFTPAGHVLRGEGLFHDDSGGTGLRIQSIIAQGRLLHDRFLSLEYTLGESAGAIQFGFSLLEFMPDGQALHGGFVGYGALVTEGIITGTVHLHRQESP